MTALNFNMEYVYYGRPRFLRCRKKGVVKWDSRGWSNETLGLVKWNSREWSNETPHYQILQHVPCTVLMSMARNRTLCKFFSLFFMTKFQFWPKILSNSESAKKMPRNFIMILAFKSIVEIAVHWVSETFLARVNHRLENDIFWELLKFVENWRKLTFDSANNEKTGTEICT